MAVTEAIQQELPKCVDDKLNANFFIACAVQNAIVKEILDCFECIIYVFTFGGAKRSGSDRECKYFPIGMNAREPLWR